jgi:hypothetical protein
MTMSEDDKAEGRLAKLRKPFVANQVSKLPKPTKQQTEAVKANYREGIRCDLCGSWHHPSVVHLDYVGHAAVTDRLLDVDPAWSWEPMSIGDDGLPRLDGDGGLWIRLTICGVTRLGYGDAQGKVGADAMKERIGDAIRNASMRFGVALDLWHKGDLHADDEEKTTSAAAALPAITKQKLDELCRKSIPLIESGKRKPDDLLAAWKTKYTLTPEDERLVKAMVKAMGEPGPAPND